MGPHNPASHPELLEELSDALRTSGYDLKQLMSWIVLSEAYGLSSRTMRGNQSDDPTLGQPPQFSHFYLRQMSAEQLYGSLRIASHADQSPGALADQQDARREWLRQFTIALGTDEGDEATTFDGTITQTLMMFNGDLIEQVTRGEAGSLLQTLADNDRQRPKKCENCIWRHSRGRPAPRKRERSCSSWWTTSTTSSRPCRTLGGRC
jgi:hypothetical protein